MQTPVEHRKSERGQTTIEFILVFPLLVSIVLLILAIAVAWHGHHLSSTVSLEGASLESAQSGWGSSFVESTGNGLSDVVDFNVSITDFGGYPKQFFAGSSQRFTTNGIIDLSWAPFNLNWSIPIQGATIVPVWEFSGGSE